VRGRVDQLQLFCKEGDGKLVAPGQSKSLGTDAFIAFSSEPSREVRAQDRSLRGESLEVSWVTYKTKRERSHGVVSSSSGRERPR
jgi:hypothetical protein